MNQTKKEFKFLKILVILNFFILLGIIVFLLLSGRAHSGKTFFNPVEKYTLYIGLNDQDTGTQIVPTEKAKQTVDSICLDYVTGFTFTGGTGAWVDENENLLEENTLIYTFADIDYKTVQSIADRILKALNQNNIMIEHKTVQTIYYKGKSGDLP